MELIEDAGLGSNSLENVPGQFASMDLDGIDLLVNSVLSGVEAWIKKKEANWELSAAGSRNFRLLQKVSILSLSVIQLL